MRDASRLLPPAALIASLLGACSDANPDYCVSNANCIARDPSSPYCDVGGDYPAARGLNNWCIPNPFDGLPLSTELTIDADQIGYGRVVRGSSSVSSALMIRSVDQRGIGRLQIFLAGADPDQFVLEPQDGDIDGCRQALRTGDICLVRVAFRPTSDGAKTASLVVAELPAEPQTQMPEAALVVQLGGEGLVPGSLTLTDEAHEYPDVSLRPEKGQQYRDHLHTFTLHNPGGSKTGTLRWEVGSDFEIDGTDCPSQLGPGESCQITVGFWPALAGARRGELIVREEEEVKAVASLGGRAKGTLTVQKTGSGKGIVDTGPWGSLCDAECAERTVSLWTPSVVVTAQAGAGSTFSGWTGVDCPGTGSCTLTLDSAKTVVASFTSAAPDSDESFRVLSGESSLSNLSRTLTINGSSVAPTFIYEGKNADVASGTWTATVGQNISLAGSGSDPTSDRGTPLTDDADKAVKFNAGRAFQTSEAGGAVLGSGDIVIESVLQWTTSNSVAAAHYGFDGSFKGWRLYETGNRPTLEIDDGPTAIVVQGDVIDQPCWIHLLISLDRSGFAQMYVNGEASGDPVDIAEANGPLSNDSAMFTIGAESDLAAPYGEALAWFGAWEQANWLDTHLQANLAKERFIKLTGFYPQLAKGTALPTAATRDATAYLDIYRNGVVQLYPVGANWMRLARRRDADGKVLTGYLAEEARANVVADSEDLAAWSAISGPKITTDQIAAPDGTLTADKVQLWTDSYLFYNASDLAADASASVSIWIYPISASGTFMLRNPNGAGGGEWTVDLSALPAGEWSLVTPDHRAVTAAAAFKNMGTNGGIQLGPSPVNGLQFYAWGAQYEEGAAATSYIRTAGASASRAADALEYRMDDGNAPGDQAGSIYAEVLLQNTDQAADGTILQFFDASDIGLTPSYVQLRIDDASDSAQLYVEELGLTKVFQVGSTDITDGKAHQLFGTWQAGEDSSLKIDGASEGTPSNQPGLAQDIDKLRLGHDMYSAGWSNGLVSNVRVFSKAVPHKSLAAGWSE